MAMDENVVKARRGTIIPNVIWKDKSITCYERFILLALLEEENRSRSIGEQFKAPQARLAEMCGVSVITVKRTIKSLQEMGYIQIGRKPLGDNSRKVINYYTINWKKLADMTEANVQANVIDLDSVKEEVEEILPIEEPAPVKKDYNRLKCRLAGAVRLKQSWYNFKTGNLYDLMDAGFSEDEVFEEYNKAIAI